MSVGFLQERQREQNGTLRDACRPCRTGAADRRSGPCRSRPDRPRVMPTAVRSGGSSSEPGAHPSDRAWRSAVVAARGGQQALRVDRRIGFHRRAFLLRHGRNNLAEHCIRPAGRHQHADDGERASRIGMDEMSLHRKTLAVDEMFARVMEMELQQPIVSSRSDREHAAVAGVHLDGVAVVDDGIDVLGPCDVQRRQLRLDGLPDVDWRLLAADGADAIGGIEVAPFGRAVGAFIAPMNIGGETSRCAQGAECNPGEQFQRLTTMHGALPSRTGLSFARSMDDLSR